MRINSASYFVFRKSFFKLTNTKDEDFVTELVQLQHRHKRLLRYFDVANLSHTFLAFFLLF